MDQNLKISYFKPEKQGVYPIDGGYCFATEIQTTEECGVILYGSKGRKMRIPFSREGKRGALYGVMVTGGVFERYNYYKGKTVYTDPYAKGVVGLERFGAFGDKPRHTFGRLYTDSYDWQRDSFPLTPYEDTIIYGLNVRGFTMHKSSGVKHRGTFEGIVEKIPYLKRLGITAVELLPAYEYDECMYDTEYAPATMEEAIQNCTKPGRKAKRLNCWGFQKGFYFSPKASYAVERPDISFKNMVRELHRSGLEILMQFYFPPELSESYILEILKYWVVEYHVDGFRLNGFQIPYKLIAQEPLLRETKIHSAYLPVDEIYKDSRPLMRHLAIDNGNFKNDMRRFLKGDENLINQMMYYQRNNPSNYAVINYLADYDGFSLFDCVSYERKHNEANGEDNRDGADINYTWNCGVEGKSRKKSIMSLRLRQVKNGICFLFLSQGTPYIFSGDEMACTRGGNNNAYCQDNETAWINWTMNPFQEEVFFFTRYLISIRKNHPILHRRKDFQIMDSLGCGYPDISYHGTEAWRPDVSYISRMIGILLCGKYIQPKEDHSFYIAYNMHWEEHSLALPKLPKDKSWMKVLSTVAEEPQREALDDDLKIKVKGRSVSVYMVQNEKDMRRLRRRLTVKK